MTDDVEASYAEAQSLASQGRNEDAKAAFLNVLTRDPTHFGALTGLAAIALATGYRAAARTAYRQAVDCHPGNPRGLVNLANVHLEDDELVEAKRLYESALAIDSSLAYAHQGLANVFAKLGDAEAAKKHRDLGFAGHSVVARPHRGTGTPPRVLLLVSAKGGNIPTNVILDDRIFAVTALYAEYHDAARPLPDHDVVFNAVGDADLCEDVLADVAKIVARTAAPIINMPERTRGTGRSANAVRLSALPDVVTPRVVTVPRAAFDNPDALARLARDGIRIPFLLRSPGFHTGQNFLRVEDPSELAAAARQLPGEELLAIAYLNARGSDGMVRKYRAMFIGGNIYPLHLAVSHTWKVHYFTAAMAESEDFRREEEIFLSDMEATLGKQAMRGLTQLRKALAFDYGGVDFGLSQDGQLLFFEANATMAIVPPAPDTIWDYRRRPIERVIEAARAMLFMRAGIPRQEASNELG